MSKNDVIVLPDSQEAASIQTVTGWVSRDGYFYGNDERLARWAGSTHRLCESCGNVFVKNSYCEPCAKKRRDDEIASLPMREWKGEPVYLESADEYFFEPSDFYDYCLDNDLNPKDQVLLFVTPNYASEIDPNEHYADDLPEEGDVPAELSEAFDALNEVIRMRSSALSYSPGKERVDPASIGSQDDDQEFMS